MSEEPTPTDSAEMGLAVGEEWDDRTEDRGSGVWTYAALGIERMVWRIVVGSCVTGGTV